MGFQYLKIWVRSFIITTRRFIKIRRLLSSHKTQGIKANAFCLYNKRDYNALVIKQQKRLVRHHAKEINMIVE